MNVVSPSLASAALAAISLLALACSGDLGPTESESGSTGSGGWSDSGSGGAATGGGTAAGGTAAGGTAAGGTAAGGTGDGIPAVIEPTFETLKLVISGYRPDINCAAADCHSGGHEHSAIPLRLVPDELLYEELTSHISVKCGHLPVVDPGNPGGSALVKLLRGPCEDVEPSEEPIPRMPYGCFENEWENNCVADEYIAAIEQWIADGAPEH